MNAERLKELLNYDADTGVFTNRKMRQGPLRVGERAGWLSVLGYRCIGLDRKKFRAARLAWLYVHGEWPKYEVDHINGHRLDDRIANLRDVPRNINAQNVKPSARPKNKTGFAGVSRAPNGTYNSAVKHQGIQVYLGTFDTPQEAHTVYIAAKLKLHPNFTP